MWIKFKNKVSAVSCVEPPIFLLLLWFYEAALKVENEAFSLRRNEHEKTKGGTKQNKKTHTEGALLPSEPSSSSAEGNQGFPLFSSLRALVFSNERLTNDNNKRFNQMFGFNLSFVWFPLWLKGCSCVWDFNSIKLTHPNLIGVHFCVEFWRKSLKLVSQNANFFMNFVERVVERSTLKW